MEKYRIQEYKSYVLCCSNLTADRDELLLTMLRKYNVCFFDLDVEQSSADISSALNGLPVKDYWLVSHLPIEIHREFIYEIESITEITDRAIIAAIDDRSILSAVSTAPVYREGGNPVSRSMELT